MEYKGSIYSQGPIVEDWAVYGAGAAIKKGAAVMRGVTLGTDMNLAILGSGALADVIGVTEEAHALVSAAADTNAAGTVITFRKICIDPYAYFRAEYDQTDTMAVASSSGTTVVVTSGETNLQGGYLYAVAGTGIGRLALIVTDNGSGSYTTKESTGWDSSTVLIKILPKWHQLVKLTTDATMIGSDAAAGSGAITVKDVWIKTNSIPLTRLDPTLHSGLTGLDLDSVKFFADIMFRNHIFNTID